MGVSRVHQRHWRSHAKERFEERVPLLGSNGFIYCNEIVSVCRDCGSWDIFPAFGGDNIELLPENH